MSTEESCRETDGRCEVCQRCEEFRGLEWDFSQQLGEMARLADVVCRWVLGQEQPGAFRPIEVLEAAEAIMEYVDAVRPPEGSKAPEWVMHIIGPDDVIDCVSQFRALRMANQHNKEFARFIADDPSPNNPYCVALVKDRTAEEV